MHRVQQAGYLITRRAEDADAIVVNTCCFIQPALVEADREIRQALRYRRRGRCRAVIVSGCLPQYLQERRFVQYPEVDAWLSPDNPTEIVKVLTAALQGEAQKAPSRFGLPEYLATAAEGRLLSTPPSLAYVKIAEGCDHRCRFCIIPNLRGRYRSRATADIEEEVRWLTARGVAEIVLVSQDSASYGRDLDSANLIELLARLVEIPGDFWLRVMYLHPAYLNAEMLTSWSALGPKLLPYFDIPVQHVSAPVLEAMGRQGDRKTTDELFARIRAVCDQAMIRTTLLVGYPGETKAQFEELLDWVQAGPVDHLGVFAYSDLPEMRSHRLVEQVAEAVKEQRRELLLAAQVPVVARRQQAQVNSHQIVLVDHAHQTNHGWRGTGRSWRDAFEIDGVVHLTSVHPIRAGHKVKAQITHAEGYDLKARVVAGHCR